MRTPVTTSPAAVLALTAAFSCGCIEERQVAYIHCPNGVCEPSETAESCPADCLMDCGNNRCDIRETPVNCGVDCPFTTRADVLFVIDNTQSMADPQDKLQHAVPSFLGAMRSGTGSLPDLHVGVVTTDLGTGSYTMIRNCERPGGDDGVLGMASGIDLASSCLGAGPRYIVDIEPDFCEIRRDGFGGCSDHTCQQADCPDEPGAGGQLTLTVNDLGCPRCRNFSGTLDDAIVCMTGVGGAGCGFEQPLEAMRRSLYLTPVNEGFLRSDSVLAVIFLTDEDDCSAQQPDILFNPDPAQNTIDSELGYLSSFRCFEFGVACDVNDRQPGLRNDCQPRQDDGALLFPLADYTLFLEQLRDPGRIVVAAVAGPFSGSVSVGLDSQDRPEVQPACTSENNDPAFPGVRLKAFASLFSDPPAMTTWAYRPVCADQQAYIETLHLVGTAISTRLGFSRL